MRRIIPVILSGGAGSRLWPLSRESRPKQFQALISDRSMLQETLFRVSDTDRFGAPLIVCSHDHRFMVAEHLRTIGVTARDIILEPMGRNTAPAIATAALHVFETDPEAVLLVLPADHHISDVENFNNAAMHAAAAAEKGRLVTFGIMPNCAHTGLGYVRQGKPHDRGGDVFAVEAFVEKPNQKKAGEMIGQGGWLWNSGIFMFGAAHIIRELKTHAPGLLEMCRAALTHAGRDLDFLRLDGDSFACAENISIDYAVMEKSNNVSVVPVHVSWSDIGSWQALWDVSAKDANGNVMVGNVIGSDTQGTYLRSNAPLVVALGVENMIVVADDDVVLIAEKSRAESVRDIVTQLKERGIPQSREHSEVYRPWGTFRTIDKGGRFLVKRLTIKPGGKLSLQKHERRAEHWVVVRGRAKVVRGDEELVFTADQSTYIPLGIVHRLENPYDEPLELIEVQTGDYLGEDDIVRLEDTYGRA